MADVSLESVLEDLLVYLSLAVKPRHAGDAVPLSLFDGAEPFIRQFNAAYANVREHQQWLAPGTVSLKDIDQPLDISILGGVLGDQNKDTDSTDFKFHVARHRVMKPTEYRGWLKYHRYVVETAGAAVLLDGTYLSGRDYFGSADGVSFKYLGLDQFLRSAHVVGQLGWQAHADQQTRAELTDHLLFGISAQFSRRYEWRVKLGYLGHPGLSFPTDPEGAVEVFRLRDIPEGRSRRAAILHWVAQHWRKKRSGVDGLITVREHLRGARSFVWNGLQVQIVPSAFDLARLRSEDNAPAAVVVRG